jgi:hypothetical protein
MKEVRRKGKKEGNKEGKTDRRIRDTIKEINNERIK